MIHIFCDGFVLNPVDGVVIQFIKYTPSWISAICAIIALVYGRKPTKRFYWESQLSKVQTQMSALLDKAAPAFTNNRPSGYDSFTILIKEYAEKNNYTNAGLYSEYLRLRERRDAIQEKLLSLI